MAYRFNIKDELAELFGVEQNPAVSFFFVGKDNIENGTAKLPEDWDKYKLLDTKEAWWDGKVWQCYGKKACGGCFSESYWKIGA